MMSRHETRRPDRSRLRAFLAGCVAAFAVCAFPPHHAASETIKVGLQRINANGGVYIAVEKGYFAAAGLTPELVFFDSPVPIAVATASRDIDFGATALTGALYSLAGKGGLRIVAAGVREAPGFRAMALVVSNRSYEAGLTSFKKLAGRSVAIPQIGSGPHYALHLVAEKYGFGLAGLRLLAMQSNPNVASAVIGGQAEGAVLPWDYVSLAAQRGEVKAAGFVGDAVQFQLSAVWVATRTANEKSDIVARFLGAYRQGVQAFHDAFAGEDGKRRDGPTAPEALGVLAKYTGEAANRIKLGVPYVDAGARLDRTDVLRQIAWYRSQGMLKDEVDGDAVIDKRYVIPLPSE